jgi:hypothetical protein
VDNCKIKYTDGNGINATGIEGSPARIINSDISNNSLRGVLAQYASILNSTITSNTGGGVDITNGTLIGNDIRLNTTRDRVLKGIGVHALGSTISSNTIANNTGTVIKSTTSYSAGSGGGMYARDSVVENNAILQNTLAYSGTIPDCAEMNGAGLDAWTSTVKGNVISKNQTISCSDTGHLTQGGGINSMWSTIEYNIVTNNIATCINPDRCHGGGIAVNYETTLKGNYIAGNTGGNLLGGGIYVKNNTEAVDISFNTIISNSSGAVLEGYGNPYLGHISFTYNSVILQVG